MEGTKGKSESERDVEGRQQLTGSIQALRLHQPFDSGLTERLRMQPQMIKFAQRPTEDIARIAIASRHTPGSILERVRMDGA